MDYHNSMIGVLKAFDFLYIYIYIYGDGSKPVTTAFTRWQIKIDPENLRFLVETNLQPQAARALPPISNFNSIIYRGELSYQELPCVSLYIYIYTHTYIPS